MNPKYLSIADFTYTLPEEKIAKYPLTERDLSRVLVFKNKKIEEAAFKNIAQYLPQKSLLIFNDTKVIQARILFQKQTGAFIEIFCLEPHQQYADITTAMAQKESVVWLCLIGGASKWKPGQILEKRIIQGNNEIIVKAAFIEKTSESFAIHLSWTPTELSFAEILHAAGAIPLPPYLKREVESQDKERYQTLYAHAEGSVAAPTAGLHFTDAVFKTLSMKKVATDYVTLHVGAGTFKPVKTNILEHHDMHAEFMDVEISTIKNIIAHVDGYIIPVGTTSMRTIESLYWMGLKLALNKNLSMEEIMIKQWDAYELPQHEISIIESLTVLLHWMENQNMSRLLTKTQILIAPGYKMKIANALITNFHQPNSTLLLLVAAFVGEHWKEIYQYALDNEFRFLSYGDSCLLFRN
jgi:S-adenosylmethionine:tRNA ribosyltransferase-isomerase